MNNERVLVLDFGGQYNRLIARRVRECGVYCEVFSYTTPIDEIIKMKPKGIILTGGPNSIYEKGSPVCDKKILEINIPLLGICYGAQVIAYLAGGGVENAPSGEFGSTTLNILSDSKIFKGISGTISSWMSHNDYIKTVPDGYKITAKTSSCHCAAMENGNIHAVQFHPEVEHTEFGREMMSNFLYEVCKCSGDWKMENYVPGMIAELKAKIGDKKVLCALSGGVDSTVSAVMAHRAAGDNLTCIFVDHGLLRKDEANSVEEMCRQKFKMNFIKVDARRRFLDKLSGITSPETKRKIIGEEFIRVFEEEAKKIGTVDFLVQGTIYPDVIESGIGDSALIKSHHNVGGLPDVIDFKEIVEPLRFLFKDEVRIAGIELGIDEEIVWRQPFPGPGLAVRVIGEITEEKLAILREADAIFREEIKNAGLSRDIQQYFAVLTDMRSVGVMGDVRTYDYTLALRAVNTNDFMTADFAKIPYETLERTSARVVNEVGNINRVVYDITSKPPATIEWE